MTVLSYVFYFTIFPIILVVGALIEAAMDWIEGVCDAGDMLSDLQREWRGYGASK